MKTLKKSCLILLLVLSLAANGILSYYLYENNRTASSLMKLTFNEYDTVIYCESSEKVTSTKINLEEGTYKIGNAEIKSKEGLLLVSPTEKINLSEVGGGAFVINSNGKLLYQLMKSENKEEVFVTPSGKKYHSDIICAGGTAFGTDLKTAENFGRSPCSICYTE